MKIFKIIETQKGLQLEEPVAKAGPNLREKPTFELNLAGVDTKTSGNTHICNQWQLQLYLPIIKWGSNRITSNGSVITEGIGNLSHGHFKLGRESRCSPLNCYLRFRIQIAGKNRVKNRHVSYPDAQGDLSLRLPKCYVVRSVWL